MGWPRTKPAPSVCGEAAGFDDCARYRQTVNTLLLCNPITQTHAARQAVRPGAMLMPPHPSRLCSRSCVASRRLPTHRVHAGEEGLHLGRGVEARLVVEAGRLLFLRRPHFFLQVPQTRTCHRTPTPTHRAACTLRSMPTRSTLHVHSLALRQAPPHYRRTESHQQRAELSRRAPAPASPHLRAPSQPYQSSEVCEEPRKKQKIRRALR
jgi:hypothetical protein